MEISCIFARLVSDTQILKCACDNYNASPRENAIKQMSQKTSMVLLKASDSSVTVLEDVCLVIPSNKNTELDSARLIFKHMVPGIGLYLE